MPIFLYEILLNYNTYQDPMKAKLLADFFIEFHQLGEKHECWSLSVDSSSNKIGSRSGINLERLETLSSSKPIYLTLIYQTIRPNLKH